MGINHTDIDQYLNDADDYEGAMEKLMESDQDGKRERKIHKPRDPASWRRVEEYFDNKRLRQALKEYYDDL